MATLHVHISHIGYLEPQIRSGVIRTASWHFDGKIVRGLQILVIRYLGAAAGRKNLRAGDHGLKINIDLVEI